MFLINDRLSRKVIKLLFFLFSDVLLPFGGIEFITVKIHYMFVMK